MRNYVSIPNNHVNLRIEGQAYTTSAGGRVDRWIPQACWPVRLADKVNSRLSDRPCLKEIGYTAIEA